MGLPGLPCRILHVAYLPIARCDIWRWKVLLSCCFNLHRLSAGTFGKPESPGGMRCLCSGYYQPMRKSTRARRDMGKHADQTAQPQCKNCAVGTYLNEMGQSTCKVCAVGKMQDEEGQSLCKDCLLMEFASAQGQSSCASCSAGQYQNEIGQTGCKLYPSGGSTGWATDTD